MKLCVVFLLAVLGSGFSLKPLSEDLLEFVYLLPEDKVMALVEKYSQMDDFLEVVTYVLLSDEFKDIVLEMETVPEYLEMLKYLEDSGLEIYGLLHLLHAAIGLPPPSLPMTVPSSGQQRNKPNVVYQLRFELRQLFPKDQIAALHEYKLNNSQDFKYFSDRIYDPQAAELMAKLKANPTYQRSIKTLNSKGLDMDNALKFYADLFGFK